MSACRDNARGRESDGGRGNAAARVNKQQRAVAGRLLHSPPASPPRPAAHLEHAVLALRQPCGEHVDGALAHGGVAVAQALLQ